MPLTTVPQNIKKYPGIIVKHTHHFTALCYDTITCKYFYTSLLVIAMRRETNTVFFTSSTRSSRNYDRRKATTDQTRWTRLGLRMYQCSSRYHRTPMANLPSASQTSSTEPVQWWRCNKCL